MRPTTQGREPISDDPQIVAALDRLHAAERDQEPVDPTLALTAYLVERGFVYLTHLDRGSFVHLTAKGAQAAGLDPGNRR